MLLLDWGIGESCSSLWSVSCYNGGKGLGRINPCDQYGQSFINSWIKLAKAMLFLEIDMKFRGSVHKERERERERERVQDELMVWGGGARSLDCVVTFCARCVGFEYTEYMWSFVWSACGLHLAMSSDWPPPLTKPMLAIKHAHIITPFTLLCATNILLSPREECGFLSRDVWVCVWAGEVCSYLLNAQECFSHYSRLGRDKTIEIWWKLFASSWENQIWSSVACVVNCLTVVRFSLRSNDSWISGAHFASYCPLFVHSRVLWPY